MFQPEGVRNASKTEFKMRSLSLFAGVALAGLALTATPVSAQDGPVRTRTIVVFGSDACPKSTNPDEIIVCARRPEEERYRIPKTLRDEEKAAELARQDNVPANRAALARDRNSAQGIGSCSAVGPGGIVGCTGGIDIVGAGRTIVEGIQQATEPTESGE